jgi:hypothetical protein
MSEKAKLFCPDCWEWQQKITLIINYSTGPLGSYKCAECERYTCNPGRAIGLTRKLITLETAKARMLKQQARVEKMRLALDDA